MTHIVQGGRGSKITLPAGKSLVDLVRQGMAATENITEAALSVGISRHVFRLMRRMLLVKDRGVLTAEEVAVFDLAIDAMQNSRSYEKALTITRPILDRHWHKGSLNGVRQSRTEIWKRRNDKVKTMRADGKARRRFDNTLFAIREACSNNDEMVLPEMTKEEADAAADTLIRSMGKLAELFARLKGSSQ